MSQGTSCKCPASTFPDRRYWVVVQRRCNFSAFSGYQCTPSDYSFVQCHICGTGWRTKAGYVSKLKDGKNLYNIPEVERPKLP